MRTWRHLILTFLIGGVTVSAKSLKTESNPTSEIDEFFNEYFEWKFAIYSPEDGKCNCLSKVNSVKVS